MYENSNQEPETLVNDVSDQAYDKILETKEYLNAFETDFKDVQQAVSALKSEEFSNMDNDTKIMVLKGTVESMYENVVSMAYIMNDTIENIHNAIRYIDTIKYECLSMSKRIRKANTPIIIMGDKKNVLDKNPGTDTKVHQKKETESVQEAVQDNDGN